MNRFGMGRVAGLGGVLAALVCALALSPTAGASTRDYIYSYTVQAPDISCVTTFDNDTGQALTKTMSLGDFVMFSPRGNQTVSYQAILFRWTDAGWTRDTVMREVVGNTSSLLPTPQQFNVGVDGYYRVAMFYRWYWNGRVEHTLYRWAGTHSVVYDIDSPTGFELWYGDTGDYCDMTVDATQ